nr:element excision factor XisI family protein [Dulcicalothrix desertica]
MDKLEHYRQVIKQVLTEHAEISFNRDNVKSQ